MLSRSQVDENLTLVAFVLLTVLIGLVLVWLATQYYGTLWKKMTGQDNIKQGSTSEESTAVTEDNDKNSGSYVKLRLYWSTAFMFCCFNICNFGVFIIAPLLKHPNLTTTDGAILTKTKNAVQGSVKMIPCDSNWKVLLKHEANTLLNKEITLYYFLGKY